MSLPNPDIALLTEDSLLVSWPLKPAEVASAELAAHIGMLAQNLLNSRENKILNVVPAYNTLLIQFDVLGVSSDELADLIKDQLQKATTAQTNGFSSKTHKVPAHYGEKVAPDLARVCQQRKLDTAELARLHTSPTYSVYAVGFKPNFAYLGYVVPELELPRLDSFRSTVRAGSVGIADRQTAIYPMDSPGGWQIIACVPPAWLDRHLSELATGDRVEFYAIDETKFLEMGGSLELSSE